MASIGTPMLWVGFLAFVGAMLALDLGVFHRKAHAVSLREAAGWSAAWVALALLFCGGVYWLFGPEKALEFATGWVIEKALSVDNLFVFVVVFGAFAVPPRQQHRVLFWGILGALVMRALFIVLGGAFLARFHWAIYVFGGLLAVTGVKMLLTEDGPPDPQRNPVVRFARRVLPVTPHQSERFFVRDAGRLLVTPLFLALIAVEVTDVLFAVDSIPAVFAVSQDPFIVFTSNIFAILGLRSLYFLLADVVQRFHLLRVGLALVLIFVGAKMSLVRFVHVPVTVSLGVVALLIGGSIAASLLWPQRTDGVTQDTSENRTTLTGLSASTEARATPRV